MIVRIAGYSDRTGGKKAMTVRMFGSYSDKTGGKLAYDSPNARLFGQDEREKSNDSPKELAIRTG
ncbi:hypothetical protein [Bacillus sp. V33-4]|uniref:hypothetical protein n=1 Tax=Bacillus sp. V33-4 TaxID=2054169 RepID=UPI000C75BAAC|nr:hypothetical protein [Bacillus sp. V33-4]PLR85284.1 hypothetical protein CVD23_10065 [Bacillus sp. V33-4]